MAPRTPRNVRLKEDIDLPVRVLLARSDLSFSELVEAALRSYLADQTLEAEANLIDDLDHSFLAATFTLRADHRELTVEVSDVEPRTEILGRARRSEAPLTQFVRVEARRDPNGRVTIELVGLPATDADGARVFVATVPAVEGVSVRVKLMDLHPLSRGGDGSAELG